MIKAIIGMHDWFSTPAGAYLLDWESRQLDAAVANIFGYHALQLGAPSVQALRANRMPHQWLADAHLPHPVAPGARTPDLLTDPAGLPFPASSLDLVVLPHTLEFSADPHATLREVERVLVPEGRVVICGINPASLWGLQQRRGRLYQRLGIGQLFLPPGGDFIGYWRLGDWLRLLGLEVESGAFGCYRPGVRSPQWLQRLAWMDGLGERWWPIFGAAYCLVAVKRVRGMRLLGPAWKQQRVHAAKPLPTANRASETQQREASE